MVKPLSFSGYKRFITCPKFYEYHDVLGEKSEIMSSALVFGSGIDTALNDMLVDHNLEAAELKATRYIFDTQIDHFFIADYDADLSLKYLYDYVVAKYPEKEIDFHSIMSELLSNQTQLSDNEKTLLNAVCKDTLATKAKIILRSYHQRVLPMIDKVETVQYEYTTKCGSKRGIIDTVLILKDGRRVIFDNKTASKPYDKDATLKSPQLALYAEFTKAEYAGFIVMNKQITKNRKKICSKCGYDGSGGKFKTCDNMVDNKRCGSEWDETIAPYSFIQIHIDKIPDINKNLIVQAMDDTIKCINNGVFPRNLNNCFSMYGAKCVYSDKCWKNK